MFLKRDKITSVLPENQIKDYYRQVFSTPQGQKVLCDMLIDLCFFDEIEENNSVDVEEQNYLRNYANKVLRKCGILNPKNVELLVRALVKMPMK